MSSTNEPTSVFFIYLFKLLSWPKGITEKRSGLTFAANNNKMLTNGFNGVLELDSVRHGDDGCWNVFPVETGA